MALNAKSVIEVAAMNAKQREAYFFEFAGYFEDAPLLPYAIRVGSKTLVSNDTMDLRWKFEKYVRNLRRRKS